MKKQANNENRREEQKHIEHAREHGPRKEEIKRI